jgi:hypothetical protein
MLGMSGCCELLFSSREEKRKMECGNAQGREKQGKGSLKEDAVE